MNTLEYNQVSQDLEDILFELAANPHNGTAERLSAEVDLIVPHLDKDELAELQEALEEEHGLNQRMWEKLFIERTWVCYEDFNTDELH